MDGWAGQEKDFRTKAQNKTDLAFATLEHCASIINKPYSVSFSSARCLSFWSEMYDLALINISLNMRNVLETYPYDLLIQFTYEQNVMVLISLNIEILYHKSLIKINIVLFLDCQSITILRIKLPWLGYALGFSNSVTLYTILIKNDI